MDWIPCVSDPLGDLPGLRLVKRPEHFACVQHPFRDAEAQVTGHDRGRPGGPKIVEPRPVLSPDVQYVFEALCGQQCDPGALVLQEGVGCDRCSVDEEAEFRRRDPFFLDQLPDAVHDGKGGVGRGGGDLCDHHISGRLLEDAQIRKRSTRVDS